jgi:alkylhydroperoxidase/carboxymuconolactone decarboxylase family protein YurZ
MKQESKTHSKTPTTNMLRETGSYEFLAELCNWDADWAEKYLTMCTNPWTNGILSRKTIELICIAINAACTNLQPQSVRRHIRAALEEGATREEILEVLKCAAALAIHSCSLGAPILVEEAKAANVEPSQRLNEAVTTPACDQMRAIGQWNQAWDPFFAIDPQWTDQFFAVGTGIYQGGVLPPKLVELLSIAFDASFTHLYAPGTRRHIKAALKLGASMEEIMEVLKICVGQGIIALDLSVPILAEELANFENRRAAD